ncbi:MAG: lysophospholipid acyltransferase family protein [Pseudomonadota bacterium]
MSGADSSAASPGKRVRRPQHRPGRVEGLLIRVLARLLWCLPLWLVHRIAGLLAALTFPFARGARAVIGANVGVAFPDWSAAEHARLVKRTFRHTYYLMAETGLVWHGSRQRWQSLIDRGPGQQLLEAGLADAVAAGRGVLLLVPHFGNWELLSLVLGEYGVVALYDPPRLLSLERPIRRARERQGATLLPIDRRGIRGILSALQSDGVVAILPDQVPAPEAGVYAPFFGRPTLTMTLVHRLMARTRPVTLLLALQRRRDRFELVSERLPEAALADGTELETATQINEATERLVLRAPEQYQWSYKRYKRPPAGVPKLY